MRREGKNLSNEIKGKLALKRNPHIALLDLNEQLGAGGRISHDVAKKVRLLNLEKDELTHSLNETESALEVEESKVLRLQTEVSQIRQEIDKRLADKGEFNKENTTCDNLNKL